jgi:TolB-like protein/Flp pilus assembly protein TadD
MLRSGSRLGAFEILAPLGAGGMGEVYRARDPKLGREVAVKVLPESLAKDPVALARFQVEARALAALSHPNILGIHDLGSEDGVAYAVMELLQGETLRDKLKDGAPLPQRKAVEYAREIARGLSAAHEKGIVHRDLKPENVFVTNDERVKILDFGLAKRTEKEPTREETSAPTQSKGTEPGTVMGTVGYMAPEQVRGLSVDHRADVFALGAILYELLTGKRAFKGLTASDTMLSVLRDEPAELSQPTTGIPPALTRILRHCLEKNPEARAHSAHDVAHELETFSSLSVSASGASGVTAPDRRNVVPLLAIGVAVLAVIVAASALFRRPASAPAASSSAPASGAGAKRVAVLPFENLGSKEDDYFADGITDEVRAKLTKVAGLGVIARTSSIGYRKTTKTPLEIGKELDVQYLLTGTVRFAGDGAGSRRVQVSPELVAASNAESKWTQPFDATLTDVFRVQGEIATKVAEALNVALSEGSRKSLEQKPTQNLAAYEAYLRGEEASQALNASDPASLRRAIDEYEKAVALDAGYVTAWARMSYCLSILYTNSTPTPALSQRARETAEKAVALAPERPEGHAALSLYDYLLLVDNKRALAEAERARALAPGDAFAVNALATVEQSLGRWEEALEHLEETRRLDPRSAVTLRRLGNVFLFLRRTAKAREVLDEALSLAPASLSVLHTRVLTDLQDGDLPRARNLLKAAPKEVEPTALVAFLANYYDLVWVLDEGQRALLFRLTPSAFDDDRTGWAISLTQAYALVHDEANVKKYAELSRAASIEQVAAVPQDAQRHVFLGLTLAYLGRKDEAIREARKGVELAPISKDAYLGPYYLHQLVRTYILTGEHEKAMDALEELMKVPYFVSKAWLKIDPNFDPLRANPRFVKLVGSPAP